jgi:hypothetical protein
MGAASSQDNATADAALRGGISLATGNPGAALRGLTDLAARGIINGMRGASTAIDQPTRDAVGQILLDTSPDQVAQMLRAHLSQPPVTPSFGLPPAALLGIPVGQSVGQQQDQTQP